MPPISDTDLILNRDGSVYHLNLKPGQIADTIITVGDPTRVYAVSDHFDKIEFEMNRREFITHTGVYKRKKLTVMSTGIGTDNIDIFLNELDALFNIDLKKRVPRSRKRKLKIIRIGTSGSIQEDIPIGTHLVSVNAIGLDALMSYYDLDQTEYEIDITSNLQNKLGSTITPYLVSCSETLRKQIAYDMVEGNSITTPGFYGPQGRILRTKPKNRNLIRDLMQFHYKDFWLTNFDMETAAYYAFARMLGHEILSVSAIIANRPKRRFSKNTAKVMEALIEKVLDRI